MNFVWRIYDAKSYNPFACLQVGIQIFCITVTSCLLMHIQRLLDQSYIAYHNHWLNRNLHIGMYAWSFVIGIIQFGQRYICIIYGNSEVYCKDM